MKKEKISVFFAVDDNYVDYLCVTLASIIDNAKNEKYKYDFIITHNGLSKDSKKRLSKFNSKRFKVSYFNVGGWLDQLEQRFKVRDYYTLTTYYRLLIPDAFFFIDKALYLDCDLVVLGDLADLYSVDLKDNYLAASKEPSMQIIPEFMDYTDKALKIPHEKYFNAGVLVMNLKKMRQTHLLRRVFDLSKTTIFKVAQDQDLLNVICKDRVVYLPDSWNVSPVSGRATDINIIHYTLIYKPWKRNDVTYQEHFWHYATKVGLDKKIKEYRDNIPPYALENEEKGMQNLIALCASEARHPSKFKGIKEMRNSKVDYHLTEDRVEVYKKIDQYELEGKFDVDVENDPPYTHLRVGDVDYTHRRLKTKFLSFVYNRFAFNYFNKLIKNKTIIIDEYIGLDNLRGHKRGAIITANHFNHFDSIPIHKAVKKVTGKYLFKIIREGNYTFPGLYGKFMKYCNTLPLASDYDVMRDMMKGVEYWLGKGFPILIYPEQSMWWNYKKPKPTKPGAFRFAAKYNVPVIPTFITLRNTGNRGKDGDFIYAYTLHILSPIYPRPSLSVKDNAIYLQQEHDKAWKELYERVYGVKLEYTTKK